MPPKIRELIAQPEQAGFINRSRKGSRRNLIHPRARMPVTISGNPVDDARDYQIKAVKSAIKESIN